MNGFCGGFANGCITAVGVFTGHPLLGNAIGGFIGNEITENFNNMDIADPQERKSQLDILGTSIFMGIIQGIFSKGSIATLGEGAGLPKGTLAYYIAKFFATDLNYMISNCSYMLINGILKSIREYIENRKNDGEGCME